MRENNFGHFPYMLTYEVKNGPFWGQNDVIGQNLGKGAKNFYLKKFTKIIFVMFMDIHLVKKAINGVNLVKIGHFW